jgi:arylsulfatase A-like enzyme
MPAAPNLLLIWTDEQRADTLACYGNSVVAAPNLNRLAADSFVCDNAYCVQPVCTPSRGSILSGLWPHQHGAAANNEPLHAHVRTLAERLPAEYRRAYYGKWHLGDEIVAQHGWDEWVSIEDGIYRPYYTRPEYLERRSDYHHYLVRHGFPPDSKAPDGARVFSRGLSCAMPYRFTKAGFLGGQAADFLRRHDPARPFALSVNFLEPHMPFFGPYNDYYDPAELPAGPAFARPPAGNASLRHRALAAQYTQCGFSGMPLRTEAEWRRLRANYYGLVTMVDRAIGEVLNALHASGLADNTIVVFTSDHGELMGDHAMLAKGVMYEEAVRVPLLLRVPWLNRGQRRIPGRLSQVDLVPTLLDLLGQSETAGLMGRSRRAVLEGTETLAGNDVVSIWHGDEYHIVPEVTVAGASRAELDAVAQQEWRTLISHEGWKLNLCTTDPQCELYDLNHDPHELTNRYAEPAQRGRIADLRARLVAWQQQVGDTAPLP